MGVLIYDNGEKYEIDPDDIYNPFPEEEEESPREENTDYNEKENIQ